MVLLKSNRFVYNGKMCAVGSYPSYNADKKKGDTYVIC